MNRRDFLRLAGIGVAAVVLCSTAAALSEEESQKDWVLLSEGKTDGANFKYYKMRNGEWNLEVKLTDLDVNPNNPPALGVNYFYEDETGGTGPISLISPEGEFAITHRIHKALRGAQVNGGVQPECRGFVGINIPQKEIVNTLVCAR